MLDDLFLLSAEVLMHVVLPERGRSGKDLPQPQRDPRLDALGRAQRRNISRRLERALETRLLAPLSPGARAHDEMMLAALRTGPKAVLHAAADAGDTDALLAALQLLPRPEGPVRDPAAFEREFRQENRWLSQHMEMLLAVA